MERTHTTQLFCTLERQSSKILKNWEVKGKVGLPESRLEMKSRERTDKKAEWLTQEIGRGKYKEQLWHFLLPAFFFSSSFQTILFFLFNFKVV